MEMCKIKIFKCFILIFLFVVLSGCKSSANHIEDAEMYVKNGDNEKAIQAYTKAINMDPNANLYLYRANLYFTMGWKYYDNAKNDYETVIKIEERNRRDNSHQIIQAKTKLAEIRIKQNADIRLREMILEGVEGISYDGEDIWTTFAIVAQAYAREGLFDIAIRFCSDGLEIKPDDQNLLAIRGFCYRVNEDFNKAIVDYSTAIKYYPNDHELYEGRGNTYSDMNENEKALNDYNIALSLKPNSIYALNNRAIVYLLLDNLDKAIADCNEVLRLDPNNAFAKQILGYIQQ